jgi:CBS domain containing-hemolysin-like protein
MSQTPTRSDPTDSEHRGLPMVVAQPDEPQEGWLTRVMRILFGWKAAATRADLEHVLTAEQPQSGFSPEEAAMLKNILGLRECRVESVMVPRADIVAVQQDIAIGELVRVFEVAAHSRLVVYNDTLDDPAGMIHIRDLIAFMAARASNSSVVAPASETPQQAGLNLGNVDLAMPLSAAKIVREILYAPPSMPVLDLLAKMQATRIHLALIIDEYGGTDGLVSMEDLVEMIVGDIADEHDEVAATLKLDGDGYVADARMDLDDFKAETGHGFVVEDGEEAPDIDSLGGMVVSLLGRVPLRGEIITHPDGTEFRVLEADPRRVRKLRVTLPKPLKPA